MEAHANESQSTNHFINQMLQGDSRAFKGVQGRSRSFKVTDPGPQPLRYANEAGDGITRMKHCGNEASRSNDGTTCK